jgi:hypothetical protein
MLVKTNGGLANCGSEFITHEQLHFTGTLNGVAAPAITHPSQRREEKEKLVKCDSKTKRIVVTTMHQVLGDCRWSVDSRSIRADSLTVWQR